MLLGEITLTFKYSANSSSRVQCIVIIQLDVLKLFFVRALNLHFLRIKRIDIDALEPVGILRFILCLFPLLAFGDDYKVVKTSS